MRRRRRRAPAGCHDSGITPLGGQHASITGFGCHHSSITGFGCLFSLAHRSLLNFHLLCISIVLLAPLVYSTPGEADYTLDDSFWNEESPVGEVERLLREYRQNQELVRNIGAHYYQIIYPVQLRHHEKMGISTREVSNQKFPGRGYGGDGSTYQGGTRARGRTGKHFHKTSLLIKAFNHKFRLDLELNTQLLAPNLMLKHFLANGAEQITKQEIEHCYYHGTVKDYPGATAAFHTCNGVSGVIHIGNETFVIHPFYGGDLSQKHPHVIFEARTKGNKGCANAGNLSYKNARRTKYLRAINEELSLARGIKFRRTRTWDQMNATSEGDGSRSRRDVRDAIKYIETALIIDRGMFEKRNGSTRAEVVHDAIQVANIADLYFRTLSTRVSLVYVETWQGNNQAQIDRGLDITRALANINDYTVRKLYKVERDTTQLLTGVTFQGGEAGIAVSQTICTPKAVGISVESNTYEPHLLAGTMAHMIGHNLGMGHDDGRECICLDWHGCIMAKSIVGLDNVQPYKFSECSKNDYADLLHEGKGLCLFNKPNEVDVHNLCGNNNLDEGEQCDCGTVEECQNRDPCCDPFTCKLKKEAKCASGECCHDCQLKRRGVICRDATNECDLAEICSGDSGFCPPDTFRKNGSPCAQSAGRCFSGRCPTLNLQCEQIWGYGGVQADKQCFEQFNSKGSVTGHCGKDPRGHYIKCDSENVQCGSLQCTSGNKYPVITGMDEYFTKTVISIKGSEYECKATTGSQAPADIPPLGLVHDGTQCGENLICVNQTCTSIFPFMDTSECPSDSSGHECYGHGVCSNENKCHCSTGWAGPDCSNPEAVTLAATTPAGSAPTRASYNMTRNERPYGEGGSDKHSTVILVIVLIAAVLSVFVGFAWTAHCFRRKTSSKKYDPPYTKKPIAKTYTGGSSANHSQEDLSIDGTKLHSFNNVSNFSRADSQRVLFRHGNHTGQAANLGRFQEHKLKKHGGYSGSEDDQIHSGEEDTVAFIDVAPNAASKLPERGILKPPKQPKDKWRDDAMSERMDAHSDGRESVSGGPVADMEYKIKDLNGYHEGIIVALKSAAVARAGSAGVLPGSMDDRHDYDYQQRATSSEKLHDPELRRSRMDEDSDPAAPCGPIRIRNLEDLIRQLEHHSSRHMSPSGSEDIRMSESDGDRHYRIDSETQARCRGRMSSAGEEEGRFMFSGRPTRPPVAPVPPRAPPHLPPHYSPHRPSLPPDNEALYESADHNDHRLREVPDSESDEFIQAQRQLARWASEDAVGGGCCPSSPPETSGSEECTTVATRPPARDAAGTLASDSEAASSSSTAAHYPEYAH